MCGSILVQRCWRIRTSFCRDEMSSSFVRAMVPRRVDEKLAGRQPRRLAHRSTMRPARFPPQENPMTQQTQDQFKPDTQPSDLSRRDFVAIGLAAGVVAAGMPASAAMPVVETMVEIKTADGTCDAAFSHPTTGTHPAVIIWPDAFGLRPAIREMGKRLAGEG